MLTKDHIEIPDSYLHFGGDSDGAYICRTPDGEYAIVSSSRSDNEHISLDTLEEAKEWLNWMAYIYDPDSSTNSLLKQKGTLINA